MISVAEPLLGEDEKAALSEVIESGWITMGEKVQRFERNFASAHSADDAVAVGSCTAGLHLILAALGIGSGDEVLVPSLTFVATTNSVLYTGAVPVLVDIHSAEQPLISLADAETKVGPRTRAVILVHYAGYACDEVQWRDFAARHGLLLIEDAAHASGLDGVGQIGAAAAFSFYGNKNMTTAEGGLVLARDAGLRERMRQMRGHGLTSGTFQRHGKAAGYDVTMLGFNYRLDELRAAVGLVQLGKLAQWNARRRELTQLYRKLLPAMAPEVTVPFAVMERSAFHIMPVLLPGGADRDAVARAMLAAGVQTSMHYPPVHQLAIYRRMMPGLCLPRTEDYAAREITLPLHPGLRDEDVACVVGALSGALQSTSMELSA